MEIWVKVVEVEGMRAAGARPNWGRRGIELGVCVDIELAGQRQGQEVNKGFEIRLFEE